MRDSPKVRPLRGRAGGTSPDAGPEAAGSCSWVSPGPGRLPPRKRVEPGARRGSERVPFCHTVTLSKGHGARGNCPVSPNQSRRPVGSAWPRRTQWAGEGSGQALGAEAR